MKKTFIIGLLMLTALSSLVSCEGFNFLKKNEKKTTTVLDTLPIPDILLLSEQIEKDPNNTTLYNQRAEAYFEALNYEAALKDIHTSLNIDSTQIMCYFTLADLLLSTNEPVRALSSLDKAISIDPTDPSIYVEAANYCLYFPQPDYDKALAYLAGAFRNDPKYADAYFMRGIIFKEKGNLEQAKASFQAAVENDPTQYNAFVQLGLIYSDEKNDLALAFFNNALKVNPKGIDALYAKGMYLQNSKKYNEAIEVYKEIVPLDQQFEKAFFNIGYCYFQLDSIDKAYNNFKIATELDPSYAEAYYNRGLCALAKDDRLDAKYNFTQALQIKPDYKQAQEALDKFL